MTLENERTYKLLHLSSKVCRHCELFQTNHCPKAPNEDHPDYKKFLWTSLSSCDSWKPNKTADEALEVLTMRKLQEYSLGKDAVRDMLNGIWGEKDDDNV